MALKLICLLTTRIFAWIQLTSRDETAKNIEILILRLRVPIMSSTQVKPTARTRG